MVGLSGASEHGLIQNCQLALCLDGSPLIEGNIKVRQSGVGRGVFVIVPLILYSSMNGISEQDNQFKNLILKQGSVQ